VLSTYAATHIAKTKINGQTGDTLGAVAVVSEVAFLVGLSAAF
jgi:cobalamin synthase